MEEAIKNTILIENVSLFLAIIEAKKVRIINVWSVEKSKPP